MPALINNKKQSFFSGFFTLLVVLFVGNSVSAQKPFSETPAERALITRAVLQRLTLQHSNTHEVATYVSHCRRAYFGCEQRVSTLIDYIYDIAQRENINPVLLTAIAWHESRFDPFAESDAGAVGLFQLLRRGAWSQGLPFVRQSRTRERCRTQAGSCQLSIVERAVYWLKKSIIFCRSLDGGLRMYNSGRCDGPSRYTRAILYTKRILLESMEQIRNNGFVDPQRPQDGQIYFNGTGNNTCNAPGIRIYCAQMY